MKWLWVVLLLVIAGLAAFVAVEYLTVSISHLPSYLPGRKKGHGHYHTRGAIAALIAFVALVLAGYLTYRNMAANRMAAAGGGPAVPTAPTADTILTEPPAEGPA